MVGWEEMLPEGMTAIIRFYRAGELDQAAACQKLLARATEQMKKVFFSYGNKLGMAARGFEMGPFAIPLLLEYAAQIEPQKEIITQTIQSATRSRWKG